MTNTRLYKIEVRWVERARATGRRATGRWEVQCAEGVRPFTDKLNAVRVGRQVAKAHEPSSLIIYKMNNKYQTEYTYPRSRDPRRSKG